jgi:hypothetical protein
MPLGLRQGLGSALAGGPHQTNLPTQFASAADESCQSRAETAKKYEKNFGFCSPLAGQEALSLRPARDLLLYLKPYSVLDGAR